MIHADKYVRRENGKRISSGPKRIVSKHALHGHIVSSLMEKMVYVRTDGNVNVIMWYCVDSAFGELWILLSHADLND